MVIPSSPLNRIQVAVRVASLHILLQNHRRASQRTNPDWLAPFTLDQSEPEVQEVGMVVFDRLACLTTIGRGNGDSISFEVVVVIDLKCHLMKWYLNIAR